MRRRTRCPRGECCADPALNGYLLSQIASRRSDHCCLFSLGAPGLKLEFVRHTGSNSALDCDGRLLRGRRSLIGDRRRSLIDDSSCGETLNLIQVKNELSHRRTGMSALGQKRTLGHVRAMSALPPKADIGTQPRDVRFVPKADILRCGKEGRYSITSSASASSLSGIVKPSVLAVLRLITNSNLVDCITGSTAAGFSRVRNP